MLARLVAYLLSHAKLSDTDRLTLVNAVINRFGIPTRSIITTDESRRILVQGQPLSIEQTQQLRESAYALSQSPALRLIRDQVRFTAIDQGFLQSSDPQVQLFYKAALWYAQEETQLIEILAGSPDSTR